MAERGLSPTRGSATWAASVGHIGSGTASWSSARSLFDGSWCDHRCGLFFFFWSSGNDIKRHSSSIPELLSPRASALLPPSFACGACRCYLRIEGSLGLFRALKPFLFHWASRRRYAFLRVGLFVLDGGYFLRCPKAGARVCGVVLLLVNVVKKKKK